MIESRKKTIREFIDGFIDLTDDVNDKIPMADLKKQVELQTRIYKKYKNISYKEVVEYIKEYMPFEIKNVRCGEKIVYMLTSSYEGLKFKNPLTVKDLYRTLAMKD